MLVKTYFERLYTHMREELYYPNRKNSGIFVVRCFCAAGSNYFPFKKGKRYTSKDVPLPRKLYDGSRTMTTDIKASFHPFETLYPIIQAAFPSLVNCLLFLVLLYYSSLFFLAFV